MIEKDLKDIAKIILFDTETAPLVAATFSLYPESIGHNAILQDWFMICASWKLLGEDKVESTSINKKGQDKEVVKKLRDVLASADIVVAHNAKKFDIKKLNARLIYHELDPLPSIQVVDTLLEARKIAQFTSNRLDYLGKHLLGEGKIETSNGLWLKVLEGDMMAVEEMTKYCEGDVLLLEKIYLRLRPYMKTHPVVIVARHNCPKCGHDKTLSRGIRLRASGTSLQERQCKLCKGYYSITLSKKDDKQDNKGIKGADKGSKE